MVLPPKHLLSKSSYLRSLQCSKSLYLYKFHYNKRDPLPEALKVRFQKGHDIGALAREKFPGGINCQPPQPWDYRNSILQTQELIEKKFPVIYEAAFQFNRVLAAVDILVLGKEGYCAMEVKSSLKISESYLKDAALQYFVIAKSGLPLSDFYFLHLNKPVDEALQYHEDIFCKTQVTDYCREQLPITSEKVDAALKVISAKQAPEVSVGEHCLKPYLCDFYGYCHSDANLQGNQNELPF
ncbi:MAG: hypothetical protein JNL47_09230 [Bacteroidia bacterium]|nr:hypothetical protein [Bacteroidia bacterium]